jgi:predicted CoA-binding protein
MFLADLSAVKTILTTCRRVAVVGLSPKSDRPSNMVARYLLDAGFTVIPVNPGQREILDLPCYPNLKDVPGEIDVVDIFRRSEDIAPVVADAIAVGAKAVWMQDGIINEDAAAVARAAGLLVVMDRCMKTEHEHLLAQAKR